MLGYRGRFAFGDASEIHSILHRIREKITRIRGSFALFRPAETPAAPPRPKRDPWVRGLALTAILLAVFTVLAYIGYVLILGQSIPTTARSMDLDPSSITQTSNLASSYREVSL
jgi:type VI secretion system protein ImpK